MTRAVAAARRSQPALSRLDAAQRKSLVQSGGIRVAARNEVLGIDDAKPHFWVCLAMEKSADEQRSLALLV